jgi:hypothetical protein
MQMEMANGSTACNMYRFQIDLSLNYLKYLAFQSFDFDTR